MMNEATKRAREILKTVGALVETNISPDETEVISDEELEQLGEMKPGSRPSEELIAEDRGRG